VSSTAQKIKERLTIADVVGSYIDLEKAGANFKAKCPFHSEKTPSFFVSPDRNSFYCFGCGAKGDIFTFVEDFEGVDFVTALKILADRAGIIIEQFTKTNEGGRELFDVIEEATKFFQTKLKEESEALLYLKQRSLAIEMVKEWRIGFAPNEWRSLKTHLKENGFKDKEMFDAGLIKENEKGGESYDRFRARIMFPIFDTAGRIIAFSGRVLSTDEEPKYLNSPDTPLFDKSKTLYGYHAAKKAMREKGFAILVEGQMDLLMSHQAGLDNTVASSGTALTSHQLTILKRLVPTLIIAYDADNAGKNATFRAWKLALATGFEVKVVLMPSGLDPADAVAKDPLIWKSAIENAKHVVDYFIEVMKEDENVISADKVLKEKILPLIKSIESAITQSRFIQKLGYISGLSENALLEELAKVSTEEVINAVSSPLVKINSGIQARAMGFLIWLRSIGNGYAEVFEQKLSAIIPDLKSQIPTSHDFLSPLLFEMEVHYGESADLVSIGNELLLHFEEEILKNKFAKAMGDLKKAEALNDSNRVVIELTSCHEISQELSSLPKKYAVFKP